MVESWDWLDERTLEIKLIPSARFSDAPPANGREITAEDVVNQYQRAFKLQPTTQPAEELTESVTAVEKLTVRFTLDAPFATYMEDVMGQRWNIVMPREITPDDVTITWEDHVGQGGGPFLLKSYSQGTSIEFEKNPNYFQESLPYLGGITEPIIPYESTVVAGLRIGQGPRLGDSWLLPHRRAPSDCPRAPIAELPVSGLLRPRYADGPAAPE